MEQSARTSVVDQYIQSRQVLFLAVWKAQFLPPKILLRSLAWHLGTKRGAVALYETSCVFDHLKY